ncbi:hypothetical protein [Pseudanabaena sp. FACHB-2040]|uniref:hypothetical protein n=1 Tax=Pseudanabaena sp. FACHB-2040 TaxID=2692859 RepID=UPI0016884DF6|nr:hypothetical protein [Pseudanabaena sp. FACHB-2040]MBD2256560.1 hypothetical protein [Pseudanabaena sp. FACHB-2040]
MTALANEAALQDTVVVPGERVGPIRPTTSRAELAELFGEEQLRDEEINVGEGFTEPGTVVDLGEDRRLTVVWTDDSRSKPLMAKDFGSDWKTPEGLGLGTSMAELKQELGDFELFGFGWDYGGSIVLENTALDEYHGDLFLRVRPSQATIEQHREAYEAVVGDAVFESTDPHMEPLEPVVYDMTVYLNPLGS